MRIKAYRQILILLVIVSGFVSCGKKNQEPKEPVYKISAIINNFKWYQNTVSCTLLVDTVHKARIIDIRSTSGGKTLTIEFINYGVSTTVNTGTYSFPNAYFDYADDQSTSYNTTSGFVTISGVNESTGTISGNFDYTVQDANGSSQVHISYGKLVDVHYSVVYK